MKSIQEIADELVDQMFSVDFDEDLEDEDSHTMCYLHAIRCAKIAAQRIIAEIDWHELEFPNAEAAKWQFVLEELETKEQKVKNNQDA